METIIKSILEDLLERMGVQFSTVRISEPEENTFNVDIDTDEANILIGRHGDTIQSLQHLLKLLVWEKESKIPNIVVDVDEYRQRQRESVLQLADKKAELVRTSKRYQILPPMSSFFRRLVHLHLASEQYEDLITESTGNGERRQVVIKMK
jgi:spoIIIJ-associated protein